MIQYNYLLDKEFLKQLDAHRDRTIYARIIALTFDENPIEVIEGSVTQGTVNIDGASAVRRTCSLSLIIKEDTSINEAYWGIKHKFKLEIGIKNTINSSYPDTIWFPQGIYVISGFTISHATNSATISINGKDKMCLLNGDLGGSLPASIDFGVDEEIQEDNSILYTKIPIYKIIREMIHAYALEPYANIIINDLDDIAVELLEYRGNVPLYMIRNTTTGQFENYTLTGSMPCTIVEGKGKGDTITLASLGSVGLYDPRVELDQNDIDVSIVKFKDVDAIKNNTYTIAKIEYGQTVGYRRSDLIYPGELISNIGESITSILDKIKNVLGEFEYFYNLEGQFIFQRKKNYIQNSWNGIVKIGAESYVENAAYTSALSYEFNDSTLITSFNNPPNLANLKNDFCVWGNRKGISGIDTPIHYRFAIDQKPIKYTAYPYNERSTTWTDQQVDWRELIYKMANDYYKYGQEENYKTTGYEQYFIDMQSFWRELYNPDNTEWAETNWWNPQVKTAPDQLNFWIDFLDTDGELGQFSVKQVGIRSKVVNDKDVTSIYFKEVPQVIFVKPGDDVLDYLTEYKSATGYTIVNATAGLEDMFSISAQGKSAQDVLDSLLYNHSYCIENINLKTIPIYYLEPNTRIFVKDDVSKINGEYIISKLSIPLTYNGQMSINAVKAPSRLK